MLPESVWQREGNSSLNQLNCVSRDIFFTIIWTPFCSKDFLFMAVAPATAKFTPDEKLFAELLLFLLPIYGGTNGIPRY